MATQTYISKNILPLESGKALDEVHIAYHAYGKLNSEKNNAVWIFHALTANSDAEDWWSGLVGEGKIFDPKKYFIVCATILGSCYGSSGPLTINPKTGKPYYNSFPQVTIRDMVSAHKLLQQHFDINKIAIGIGGSMGGYQLMEWAIRDPTLFEKIILLTTSAKESAWGIAIHTAQRLAIETDPTWQDDAPSAGAKGLKTARAIGMLTYRNYEQFVKTQDDGEHKLDDFKASAYINYQGDKLVNRFNAQAYRILSKAMDSHNVGRGRGGVEKALAMITAKTLVIGISSDILCPISEQKHLAEHIKNAKLVIIDSSFGHDGFLIESEVISKEISDFI